MLLRSLSSPDFRYKSRMALAFLLSPRARELTKMGRRTDAGRLSRRGGGAERVDDEGHIPFDPELFCGPR